ncbi:predicted protein [Nematostella vectensis]|uniref:Protein FAM60A n=1 Tax=Nematostella vectensis TaxID=45351 RepID=A7S3N6_NEMVE|nr:predicted protein [Nematostella vectensis]|eukprot:XP_001633703.1 predicted protein [Nematostella vectensis]
MFPSHRPKIFRSRLGCCICKAKSSSSRFTSSAKYEHHFEGCFALTEKRQGEICNACVLLVKRWSKLPPGTEKNWKHLMMRRSACHPPWPAFRQAPPLVKYPRRCQTSFLFPTLSSSTKLPYIDLSLWRREEICCGTIFRGPHGEVLVDPKLLKPLCTCSTSHSYTKNTFPKVVK